MKMFVLPIAAVLAFTSVSAAMAEERMREITVNGAAEISAPPDMAMVQVGVTHQDREATRAMAAAASGATAVMERLATLGIEARDMQTSQVSLNPVWSNRTSSGAVREITGFVARISVSLRVRELEQLGSVLDAVVMDGANQLGGIRFGFENPEALLAEARADAVADGREKAMQLAAAAGVSLGALQSLTEHGGGGFAQPMAMEMAAARDASIPIAAGEMSVSASVSMVYHIAE